MFRAIEEALRKVFDKAFDKDRFASRFSACLAGCAALTLLPLALFSSDLSVMLYVVATVPIVCLCSVILSLRYRGRGRVAGISIFAAFLLFTAVLMTHFLATKDAVRWFAWGWFLKAEVQDEPELSYSPLKHVEWDGWGFAGNDTTVYLVFDPKNTLATAAKTQSSGKFGDLPCEVYRVRRRESQWYTVQFYTDTDWDDCET